MNISKIENKLYEKTAISGIFIREYLPGLPAVSVKLYLYLVYASEHDVECDENALALILNCDIFVVKENLLILESMGLIMIENNTIIIADIIQKEIERNYRLRTVARPDDINSTGLEKNYARAKVQKAVSDKFFSGQMTIAWYNEIDSWFDKYGFEPDVVFLLFQHCSKKGVMTRPYIRKVAESWGEKYHIRTSEQVEAYIESYEEYKTLRGEILKRLKWRRNMNVYEEEIIEKWFYTYKYNLEIIEIALKRSVTKNNPTLATFDAIITSWYKNGFKTTAEIESYEEKRKMSYAAAKKANNPGSEQSRGDAEQKGNFKQRKYDEDFLNSFIISEDDNA